MSLTTLALTSSAFAAPQLPCADPADSPRQAALACLDDDNHESAALLMLAWLGTKEDVKRIVPLAEDNALAVRALVGIGGPQAHQAILETANNPNANAWGAAVEGLGSIGGPEALSLLTQYVDDPDIGGQAADGLAAMGTPEALAVVADRFRSSHGDREAWLYADSLRQFPAASGAADILWDTVAKDQWPQSDEALDMLAQMGDSRVIPAVEKRLASPFIEVRDLAIDVLEEMPAAETLPVLRQHLANGPAEDAQAVAEAMLMVDPSTRDELVAFAKNGPEDAADGVVEAVWPYVGSAHVDETLAIAKLRPGKIADRLRDNLFSQTWLLDGVPETVLAQARLEFDRPVDQVEAKGLSVLLKGGVSADRKRLVELAHKGPTAWRVLAIDTLAEDLSKATDELLLGWVYDDSEDVSDAAIGSFEYRSPASRARLVAALTAKLPNHTSSWGSWQSLLADHGGTATDRLVTQIRQGTGTERDGAISALVYTERTSDLDRLLALVPDLDADGRERVLIAVLDSERARMEQVVDLLNDPDDDVAMSAIEALVLANPPDAVDQLDAIVRAKKRSDDVREAALEGLAALAPKDLEARLQRYVKKAPLTTTALSLLVEHGTPSALAFVKDIARTDRDPETRVAAVDAFWERGTDLFIELLDDPADDVREAALNALGRQGNSKAASIAEARLNHEDPARAAEAAGVLLDLGGAPAVRNDARIRTLAKGNSMLEWKLD